MALLDEKRDALLVRIVYDGPPFSGKTTTLMKLSEGLARKLETPEQHDGRTLFFDWLDYTAGRFEGRPIRCQVVGVPGQRSLGERRRHLLKDADSVVFVADTGSLGIELSLKYARELHSAMAAIDTPRPAIVVQANKRDVADALPLPKVVERFRAIGIEAALVETTAKTGTGVREAFLFGVRLALDRVRELSARGLLKKGRPEIDSSDDLLDHIKPIAGEAGAPALVAIAGTEPIRAVAPSSVRTAVHAASDVVREALAAEQGAVVRRQGKDTTSVMPDPSVPSGFIWPPIEGRVMVQQALAGRTPAIERLPSGDLQTLSPNGWHVHSRANDAFDDQNAARAALIDWARLHVRNQPLLSDRRCIALSPDGARWRLWQLVGITRSLDDFLTEEARGPCARSAAAALLAAASKLTAASAQFGRATVKIPVALCTVGADSVEGKFVGLMPGPERDVDGPRALASGPTLIKDRMAAQVQQFVGRFGQSELLAELELIAKSVSDKRPIAASLVGTILASKVA